MYEFSISGQCAASANPSIQLLYQQQHRALQVLHSVHVIDFGFYRSKDISSTQAIRHHIYLNQQKVSNQSIVRSVNYLGVSFRLVVLYIV